MMIFSSVGITRSM